MNEGKYKLKDFGIKTKNNVLHPARCPEDGSPAHIIMDETPEEMVQLAWALFSETEYQSGTCFFVTDDEINIIQVFGPDDTPPYKGFSCEHTAEKIAGLREYMEQYDFDAFLCVKVGMHDGKAEWEVVCD